MWRRSFPILVGLFSAALLLPACAADDETEAEDFEAEVSSSEVTSSAVNCAKTKMTAYDRGKAYTIEVIAIGSKRASLPTGHAFLKMQAAAKAAGVTLSLSSGFRTNDEQQYFYN